MNQLFHIDRTVAFCQISQFFIDDPNMNFNGFAYSEYPNETSITFIEEMDNTYRIYGCGQEIIQGVYSFLKNIF